MINNTIHQQSPTKHIDYIDAMRGVAMLLVVYYHIINGALFIDSEFCNFCVRFRMPLFFFISGFLSYTTIFTADLLKRRSYNRFFGQLLPTIVFCFIYIFISGHSIESVFFDQTKLGYWFTIAMFEVYIIYAFVSFILAKRHVSNKIKCIVFIALIVFSHLCMSLITRYAPDIFQNKLWTLTSIGQGLVYFKYFLFGVLCKMCNRQFFALIDSKIGVSLLMILFVILLFVETPISLALQGFLGATIVFTLFRYYNHIFSKESFVGRNLIFIGKQTLEIYLIHFILLFGIQGLNQNDDFIKLISENSILEVRFVSILSFLLICLSIIIASVFKISPILHSLLFGFKK